MTFNTHNYEDLGARVEISAFAPADKVKEYHVMIHIEGRAETFQQQLQRLQQAEQQVRSGALLSSAQVVFKRYMLSDSTNKVPLIHDDDACTISFIQQ